MDQVDLEAATEMMALNTRMNAEQERDVRPGVPPTLNQLPAFDPRHNARLYQMVQGIVEEFFQALPRILRQQLKEDESRSGLLDEKPAEESTVTGAKEITAQSTLANLEESTSGDRNGPRASDQAKNYPSVDNTADNFDQDACSKDKVQRDSLQGGSQVERPNTGLGYKQRVVTSTQAEIDEENEQRRAGRKKWRGSEDCAYLEDPWKNLRKDNKQLFHEWTNEQRRRLQLNLIDALLSAPTTPKEHNLEKFFNRGLSAISCWIGLIGLRLGKLPFKYTSAFKQIQVLIECIWVCNSSGSATVSDVLVSCYRRRILDHPYFDETIDIPRRLPVLRGHVKGVRMAIYLLNVLYKHETPMVDWNEDLKSAWAMPLAELELRMRPKQQVVDNDLGRGSFFTVNDFNLRDLQRIGRLEVQWTAYWDEHLEIQTNGPSAILKLYWFSPMLSEYFQITNLCSGTDGIGLGAIAEEAFRTLDMVLNRNAKRKKLRGRYEKLSAPEWLRILVHDKVKASDQEKTTIEDVMDSFSPSSRRWLIRRPDPTSFCWEIKDHMQPPYLTGPNVQRITYVEFPFYYHRLRELRNYMDSRQPDGFLDLWRDKRNSNVYYKFWLVAIFGGFGVFFSFSTLAVSVVQAWASVKAMEQR
ncbi:MAG: hypothetical protein Q9200_006505 [Gallowayella weberi]